MQSKQCGNAKESMYGDEVQFKPNDSIKIIGT